MIGFNYAYRRTATTAATPASPHPQNTVTTNASSQAPTKGPTPAPPANDRQLPPHLKSTGPTPNPASPAPDANKKEEGGSTSAKAEGSTKPTTPAPNGNAAATSPVPSATGADGKPEKSKNQKKKEKLEQKKAAQAEREKQARETLAAAEVGVARQVQEAALLYAADPVALKLRQMNLIYEMNKERGATILIPSDLAAALGGMLRNGGSEV